jgi:hypothetical protein
VLVKPVLSEGEGAWRRDKLSLTSVSGQGVAVRKVRDREDALANTPEACATQKGVFARITARILRTLRVLRTGVPELRPQNAVSR